MAESFFAKVEPFNSDDDKQDVGCEDNKQQFRTPRKRKRNRRIIKGQNKIIGEKMNNIFQEKLKLIGGPTTNLVSKNGVSTKKFTDQCRLSVRNLPCDINLQKFREMFEQFGNISQVRLDKKLGVGFVKLDSSQNAENAKASLDCTGRDGESVSIRFASHNFAFKVKNLSPWVSDELLEAAFSVFGDVESAVVMVDEQKRSVGEGIVTFDSVMSGRLAIRTCKKWCYLLTSSPRPVVCEPMQHRDEEDGLPEKNFTKSNKQYLRERKIGPRFAEPGTLDFVFANRWKKLYELEKQKREQFSNEILDDRRQLNELMEHAINERNLLREESYANEVNITDAPTVIQSISMDTLKNEEHAEASLDSTVHNDKSLPTGSATHKAAIRVKCLSPWISNELLKSAFSIFGDVERAVVTVDEEIQPIGEGIVEFAKRQSAQSAIERCNEGCFLLTRSPLPVVVEPLKNRTQEFGLPEKNFSKSDEQYLKERKIGPRFAEPRTFDFDISKRWQKLYNLHRRKCKYLEKDIAEERMQLDELMKCAYERLHNGEEQQSIPVQLKREISPVEEQGRLLQKEQLQLIRDKIFCKVLSRREEENMTMENEDVSNDSDSDKECQKDCLESIRNKDKSPRKVTSSFQPIRKKAKIKAAPSTMTNAASLTDESAMAIADTLTEEEKVRIQLMLNEEKRQAEEHLARMKLIETKQRVQEQLLECLKANPSCINTVINNS